jgi:hypothetical protein
MWPGSSDCCSLCSRWVCEWSISSRTPVSVCSLWLWHFSWYWCLSIWEILSRSWKFWRAFHTSQRWVRVLSSLHSLCRLCDHDTWFFMTQTLMGSHKKARDTGDVRGAGTCVWMLQKEVEEGNWWRFPGRVEGLFATAQWSDLVSHLHHLLRNSWAPLCSAKEQRSLFLKPHLNSWLLNARLVSQSLPGNNSREWVLLKCFKSDPSLSSC